MDSSLSIRFVLVGPNLSPESAERAPILPQAGQRHQALVRQCNGIGLLSRLGFLPLVKVIDGHETATLLECFPESGLAFDPLGLGVDIGEANFDVLGQNGTRPDRITSKLRSWAFAS